MGRILEVLFYVSLVTGLCCAQASEDGLLEMDYILDDAPATLVVDFLKDEYKEVEFRLHPSLNGFYVSGSREDLLRIRRELTDGGREPGPPMPDIRLFFAVKSAHIVEVRAILESLVPTSRYRIDAMESLLVVEGPRADVHEVRELLAELERANPELLSSKPKTRDWFMNR